MSREKVPPMLLYAFHDAPEDLRVLSPHGGDEDYCLFVPKEWGIGDSEPDEIPWDLPIDRGRFGCCSVSRHEVADGWVFIGAHA